MNDQENKPTSKGLMGLFEEKQSQIATVLIGVLLIIAGALTYNFFKTANQPTNNQGKISFGDMVTPSPTIKAPEVAAEKGQVAGAYIVKSGDSLWKIAQEKMGSGFQWRELAQANNISLDNTILRTGQTLTIPEKGQVASGTTTTKETVTTVKDLTPAPKETPSQTTVSGQKLPTTYNSSEARISSSAYTVVRGDNLWNIAQKLYGDGAKWHVIFDYAPNRLSMYQPDGQIFPLIHAGNVLTIPALP